MLFVLVCVCAAFSARTAMLTVLQMRVVVCACSLRWNAMLQHLFVDFVPVVSVWVFASVAMLVLTAVFVMTVVFEMTVLFAMAAVFFSMAGVHATTACDSCSSFNGWCACNDCMWWLLFMPCAFNGCCMQLLQCMQHAACVHFAIIHQRAAVWVRNKLQYCLQSVAFVLAVVFEWLLALQRFNGCCVSNGCSVNNGRSVCNGSQWLQR